MDFPLDDLPLLTAAVRLALAGGGVLLGQGNFGIAYRVETPVGPVVVKLPTSEDIHGRARLPKWQRDAAVVEGLALEGLAAHPIVPRGRFLDVDGVPVVVREYGILAPEITPAELDAIGSALFRIVAEGWRVLDVLLLARREDGSIFVADVGLWQRPEGEMSQRDMEEDAGFLLHALSRSQSWSLGDGFAIYCAAEMESLGARYREADQALIESLQEEEDDGFFAYARNRIGQKIREENERRRLVGLPTVLPLGVPG